MVVLQIDIDRVALDPTECHPPVAARIDRVAPGLLAFERVEPEAGRFISRAEYARDSGRSGAEDCRL